MNTKLRFGLVTSALVVVLWTVVAAPSVDAATQKTVKLTAPNPVVGDRTGWSVAIGDGTMVVGAPTGAAPSSSTRTGVAYFFQQDPDTGGWDSGYPVSASNGIAGDLFGSSLAMSGDMLVVGAPRVDAPGGLTDSGAVYVFRRQYDLVNQTWSSWTLETKLTAKDGTKDEYFGWSLAMSGDMLVVGAPRVDAPGGLNNSGAVYVFRRQYDLVNNTWSSWTQEAKLTAKNAAAGDQFGTSVCTDGQTIVVGAPYRDPDLNLTDTGAVYVFTFKESQWVEEVPPLAGTDARKDDRFGAAVSLDGETLAVGAPGKTCDPANDPECTGGSVYLFARENGIWSEKTKLAGAPAQGGDQFGAALSLSSPMLAVGAPNGQIDGGMTSGYAYLLRYDGNDKQWKPTPRPKLIDDDATENEDFGFAVAMKGNRVIVGAPNPGLTGSVSEFIVNQPPVVASATASPSEVHEGDTLNLNGSASDPDEGDVLTYHWVQVGFAGLEPVRIVQPYPNEPQAAFVAPTVPPEGATLTFQLTVNDGEENSEPAEVSVVVTKPPGPPCQVTSHLGEKLPWIPDWDTFIFPGNTGEKVTLTLQPAPDGTANGGQAVLILQARIRGFWFFRANRGALPNQIQATLPATGEYLVTVVDDLFCRRSARFRGDYVLSLGGASGCLEPTQRALPIKKKVEPPANSCHQEESLTEGFWF